MLGLKIRMFLLTVVMFAVIYAVISVIASSLGVGNFYFYLGLSLVIMLIQYLIGPKIVEWSMRVRYIGDNEYPELRDTVRSLAKTAGIPVPRIGIAQIPVPNAFAFGRTIKDSRICVTEGAIGLFNNEELKAVLGHEMSHVKNRDVLTIMLLSVIPMILYRIAWQFMFYGGRREKNQSAALIGLAAFIFYFLTNLLVLYASRIREYFADKGSVDLGNKPSSLASALYKLAYGSARMPREALQDAEGLKAFFANDPARAASEFSSLRELDIHGNGTISDEALRSLSAKDIKLKPGERIAELFSTHPNMLKRVKRLSGQLGQG